MVTDRSPKLEAIHRCLLSRLRVRSPRARLEALPLSYLARVSRTPHQNHPPPVCPSLSASPSPLLVSCPITSRPSPISVEAAFLMGDLPSSSRVVPIPPVRISLVDPIPKLSPFTSLPFNGRSPLLVSSPLVQITSRLPFPMSSKSPPASCLPITSRLPSFSSLANHLPPYVIKSHRTCGSNGRLRLRVDPSCLARRHCPPVLLLMGRSAGSTLVGGPSVLRVDARLEAEGVPASRTLVLATLHSPRLLSSNHLPPPVPLSRVSRHCPPVSRRAAGDRCRRRSSAWEGGREATRRGRFRFGR